MEFAASVLTIVETSKHIMKYLGSVKSASESRRLLHDEVMLLWLTFRGLEEDIELTKGLLADESWVEPLKILDGPEGTVAQTQRQLADLKQKLTSTQGRFGEAVSTLRWPFQEREAMNIVRRLGSLKHTTMLALEQSSHRMSREMWAGIGHLKTVEDDSFFEKLQLWLTPIKFVSKQREVLGETDPYSCHALGSATFQMWQTADLRTLWYYGAPGAGKSVAAASIYAELSKQYRDENVAILGAYCSFDDEASQSPREVVASFLKQILQVRGSGKVPPKLKAHYSKASTRKDKEPLDLTTLTEILRSELELCDGIYIILDGLDEVRTSVEDLIKAVHDIGPKAKIIMTSRPSADILDAIQATQVCSQCKTTKAEFYWRCTKCQECHIMCELCRTTPDHQDDQEHPTVREVKWRKTKYQPQESQIRGYVTRRMDSDRNLRRLLGPDSGQQVLRDSVIGTVTEKSERIFMLARLHMDALRENLTLWDLERSLEDLKPSLNRMYSNCLERMKKSLKSHPHWYKLLIRLLSWVAWSHRTLSVRELEHALAIRPGIDDIRKGATFPIPTITDWSAGLLFIDSKDLVRFIHPTTSQFFVDQRDKLYPGGDSTIAHDCMHYLSMDVLRGQLSGPDRRSLFLRRLEQYPLIDYAVLHSFEHKAKDSEPGSGNRAARFLLSDAKTSFVQALYNLDPTWNIETDVSALHIATNLGRTDLVSALIDAKEDVNRRDAFGVTPLMYAAARGNSGLPDVKLLLEAGADASLTCNAKSTALIRAVSQGATSVVIRLLRENDVNINAVPSELSRVSAPALILAARSSDNLAILRGITAREDVKVNQTEDGEPKGLTALDVAAKVGNSAALSHLLINCKGVNIDGLGQDWSPIYHATTYGHLDCLETLLNEGADINRLDSQEGNILMRAVDYDLQDAVRVLIRRGIDLKCRDRLGRNVLHSAAINASSGAMRILLGQKAITTMEINAQSGEGETPLHDSCRKRDLETAALLVNAGARCDIKNNDGRTPLDIAISTKMSGLLEILKKAPGYSDVGRAVARKTLMEAVASDPVEVLRVRLENVTSDDLSVPRAFAGTPLHVACRHNRVDVAEMLLLAGTDINSKNSFGSSALDLAINLGYIGCVKLLLSHGVDVENSPKTGTTMWQHAWNEGHWDSALLLIEHGARVDMSMHQFQRAFQRAASCDAVVAMKRLVEAGASIHQKIDGYTAIQRAERGQANAVLEYISSLEKE